jgi:hypothetical protein
VSFPRKNKLVLNQHFCLIAYIVPEVKGNNAINRARLIAWATMRCCFALVLRRLRE